MLICVSLSCVIAYDRRAWPTLNNSEDQTIGDMERDWQRNNGMLRLDTNCLQDSFLLANSSLLQRAVSDASLRRFLEVLGYERSAAVPLTSIVGIGAVKRRVSSDCP